MSKDYFQHKAKSYEQKSQRVVNVNNIANTILKKIKFDKAMQLMDFGSGTGLLLERIAPSVDKITAIDISKSMNEQLLNKKDVLECELEIIEMNLATSNLDRKFDGIISSMTMHHVDDIASMFRKFHSMLNEGGFIAIADLDTEDGSFHSEDTGVFHFGFDRKEVTEIVTNAGFNNVEITTASTINKSQGEYTVFSLTAIR